MGTYTGSISPGLDIVATAASYGVDSHEANSTDEPTHLLGEAIADRDRTTPINVPTTLVVRSTPG